MHARRHSEDAPAPPRRHRAPRRPGGGAETIPHVEELSTARLRLRPWRPDDEADVAAALAIHRHPELARFVPHAVCADADQAAALLRRWTDLADGPWPDPLGVRAVETLDTGQVVALILLKPIPPSGREPDAPGHPSPGETWDIEIGWRVDPAHAGHGYVTEAADAVVRHGIATGIDRIVAVTHPDNRASQAVAERIGMRRVGLTRRYYDIEATLFDITRPTTA